MRKPVVHLHHREIWNMIQEVEFLHPWGWFCPNFWTNRIYKRKGTKQTNLEALNSTKSQKASLPVEVRRAMLVSQNNETAAMLVSQTTAVEVELFSYANAVFCSKKFA